MKNYLISKWIFSGLAVVQHTCITSVEFTITETELHSQKSNLKQMFSACFILYSFLFAYSCIFTFLKILSVPPKPQQVPVFFSTMKMYLVQLFSLLTCTRDFRNQLWYLFQTNQNSLICLFGYHQATSSKYMQIRYHAHWLFISHIIIFTKNGVMKLAIFKLHTGGYC